MPLQKQTHGYFKDELLVHFLEKKRVTAKNIEQRQTKWRNLYQTSGGQLFVVCDNRSCMRNIRSEINYCLGQKPVVISLTNIADLQAGKRGEGDRFWLEQRWKRDDSSYGLIDPARTCT